jgi:biopolymer transport protein ExbD
MRLWFRKSITECPIIEMLTMDRLRHAFGAAFAALFLVVLFAVFIVPNSATAFGGIPVWTPIFSGARVWNGADTDLVVTIQRDGSTFVGMNFVPAHQLPSAIASALALDEGRTLVLRADRRSPFAATRAVFRAAETRGVRRIVLPTGVYSISDLASAKAGGPPT